MIPIPAIDLKGGKVVRLLQGNFNAEKVYAQDARVIAKRFEEEGARRLHVVDLDGALGGKPLNRGPIEDILGTVKMPVEVGGGIRDLKTVDSYFGMGVRWAILGTKACLDEGFMREAANHFKERIIVGIDARNGLVATDGWTKVTTQKASDLVQKAQNAGIRTIIYTDISKDGAMQGPNLSELKAIASGTTVDIIASGGVTHVKDLKAIQDLGLKNITGAIIGKALYEGTISLSEAVKTCLPNG